jgi:antitoxin component YwqK of YwqJK toxin-antitoxin module
MTACRNPSSEHGVVSQKYIHKYGYAVSKEDWDTHSYPGHVVTNTADGVTITASYEHGILHGLSTYTYPYSTTIETALLHQNGELVKETRYDRTGLPLYERLHLSPSRYTLTTWYNTASPLSIEEWSNGELVEGQYLTLLNETESRVIHGDGMRVRRDPEGTLLSRDTIQKGWMVRRETFFPSGSPESITHYVANKLDGPRTIFNESGEPLAVEEWKNGKLHGLATYFNNGTKVKEVSYLYGQKNGLERDYLDGVTVTQEVVWENDQRHGPSIYYDRNNMRTEWYYNGTPISQRKFEEQTKLDEMIANISSDVIGNTMDQK